MSAPVSAFGAAGAALGHLAQVDYALFAALERLDDEDDFAVSIETLDDIVFHDAADAITLFQQAPPADLDDAGWERAGEHGWQLLLGQH